MVQEVAKHVPDVATFAANVVVFLAAIGAAVAGSMAMVKKIKAGWEDTFPNKTGDVITQQKVLGTLMMETTTAARLSESNFSLAKVVEENTDEVRELRFAVVRMTDEMKELRHEMQRRP